MVLGQLIHWYNSSHSSLSSFRILASMPRKKTTRKSASGVAPNSVFCQIAQLVRRNRLCSSSLHISPTPVRQSDHLLPPSTWDRVPASLWKQTGTHALQPIGVLRFKVWLPISTCASHWTHTWPSVCATSTSSPRFGLHSTSRSAEGEPKNPIRRRHTAFPLHAAPRHGQAYNLGRHNTVLYRSCTQFASSRPHIDRKMSSTDEWPHQSHAFSSEWRSLTTRLYRLPLTLWWMHVEKSSHIGALQTLVSAQFENSTSWLPFSCAPHFPC